MCLIEFNSLIKQVCALLFESQQGQAPVQVFFYEQIPARFGEIANTPVPLLNLYLFHKLLQIIFENILICFIKILGKIIHEIIRIERKSFVSRIVIWGEYLQIQILYYSDTIIHWFW